MSIDIAPYLVSVEKAILKATGGCYYITPENWNVLLVDIDRISSGMSEDIMQEVLSKEGRTWEANGAEAKLLALGTLLTAWGACVFKSKSENPEYNRKDDAIAVNKHTSTLIQKMVEGSMKLGAREGRPEDVHELIEI